MEPKKKNPVKIILYLLFIIYIIYYLAISSGYYESKIRDKTILTEEGIKKFEYDIQNNNPIDVESYYENNIKDYSNKYSDLGNKVSITIENIMNNGITSTIKIIQTLFKDQT